MKKIIFHTIIFGCIAISQTAFSETVYKHNQVQLKKGSNLVYDLQGNPLNGIIEYKPSTDNNYQIDSMLEKELRYGISFNESTIIRASFKNGHKDGKWQKYEDDTLIEEFTFQNGWLNGTYTEFDRSHIGTIRQQKEFHYNQCIQQTDFKKGKPRYTIKIADDIETPIVSKITGLPIPKFPKETKCEWKYFTTIAYYPNGKIAKEKNNKTKTIKWYRQDGTISAYKETASTKIKEMADALFSAYYENGKPLLNLFIKGNKSTGGEYYDKNGKRTRLDASQATDYLMDFVLSQSIGGI